MATLAPQFAALQDRLGALGAVPAPPPGPPGAPVLAVPMLTPPAVPAVPGAGFDISSILMSPWLWVAIAVLLLAGLYMWYNSQKNKE